MSIKTYKNNILIDEFSDEDENTNYWSDSEDKINDNTIYFDCGCCDECMCDEDIPCMNCDCECCVVSDIGSESSDMEHNTESFTMNIIQDTNKQKKVRITIEVMQNNKLMCIDVDISKDTYLQVAEELLK